VTSSKRCLARQSIRKAERRFKKYMHKFKKIASLLASTLMVGSTIGLAAATSYPAPFVSGGTADVALVYGSHSAATVDLVAVMKIQDSLNTYLTGGGGTGGGGSSISGGDYVLLAKSSDNLNLNNNWGVFTGSVDNEDMPVLLADGTYRADDNDEFDYEQTVKLGTPTFTHFRDSNYEDLVGLTEKTPVIGFKISSNTYILNYTLDFTTDVETDVVSATEMDDIEGSDLPLFGGTYYVSDFKNGTDASAANFFGKLTLLDSSTTGIVKEGETVTKSIGDTSYDVSIAFISSTTVKFTVNGETTNSLAAGESYKLSDGTYVGAKEITKLEVSGEDGSAEFSLGSGKLEITTGSDIELNDVAITGVKGYVHKGTGTDTTRKLDKIVLQWITEDEEFITPDSELVMPGFKTLKFSMTDLVRPEEEKISFDVGDNDIDITIPLKDGDASFGLLFNDQTTGNFTAIGKATDERLATSEANTLRYYEKYNGNNFHKYFIASYNISSQAESYMLKATVTQETTGNKTTISKYINGGWEVACGDRKATDNCDIGLVSLTISDVNRSSGGANESVLFTAGADTNFHTAFTAGGLKIYLPYTELANSNRSGSIHLNTTGLTLGGLETNGDLPGGSFVVGHGPNEYYLFFEEEDKDDTISGGTAFNITFDDTTSTNNPLQVSQVMGSGTGGSANSVTWGGLEGTNKEYEFYIKSDVGTRGVHFTNPDEDTVEIYYPTGDSETWAEVYLMDVNANLEGGSTSTPSGGGGGSTTVGVAITDSEVGSASGKNLVVVGGSCVNSVAADLIGSATPLCGADWTAVTNVGSGEFLIETFDQGDDTVATLVGGYAAGDTQNAATFLTTQEEVDTTAGSKYIGTSSTNAEMVTSDGGGDDADAE
jgi:hypothetical protein